MKYNFRSDGRERKKCIEKRKIMLQEEEKMKTEVVQEKKEGCEMKNKRKTENEDIYHNDKKGQK